MSLNTTFHTCKTCSETLHGTYCHQCGEKVVEDNDFHFRTLIRESIGGIFNIDSKVFKSFYFLLLKPGKLTVNYVDGVRIPFMKPIQLFLLTNLLFFLFLTQADIFRIPSKYYFIKQRQVTLTEISQKSGLSELELMTRFDADSTNYSKLAIIILIPFFAIILLLINYNKRFSFGKHIIFALHFFSFFMLFCLLLIVLNNFGNIFLQAAIVVANFLYLFFAIKTFYGDKLWMSLIKAAVTLVFFLSLIMIYRGLVSDLTLKLLP